MRRSLSALSLAGLALFVALDIVLVYLAFQHTAARPERGATERAAAPSTIPVPSPAASDQVGVETPSSRQDPSDGDAAGSDPLAGRRVLLAVSADGGLIRAITGDCTAAETSIVQISRDGGRTFAEVAPPAELAGILRVGLDAESAYLVGTDGGCSVHAYTTTAESDGWEESTDADESWHPAPTPAAKDLHAPTGRVTVPCTSISLAAVDDEVARVLCEGGTVLGTDDSGKSWVALGTLDDGIAITYSSPGDGYGLAETDECPGALMVTGDGGASWDQVRCFDRQPPRAMAAAGDLVAVQTGRQLLISDDRGESWQVVSGRR